MTRENFIKHFKVVNKAALWEQEFYKLLGIEYDTMDNQLLDILYNVPNVIADLFDIDEYNDKFYEDFWDLAYIQDASDEAIGAFYDTYSK